MSIPSAPKPESQSPRGKRVIVPPEKARGQRLGRILINMNVLSKQQVTEALTIQEERKDPLGQILIELGHITKEDLEFALASQYGMNVVDLGKMDISPDVLARLTSQMARTYHVIPYEFDANSNTLMVAVTSAENFRAIDDLRTLLGCDVQPALTGESGLQVALERFYPENRVESMTDLINELASDEDLLAYKNRGDSIDLEDIKVMADSNPVKRLLNLILLQAIKDKASDIHFEPFDDEYKLRYRIDGVLYDMVPPPKYVAVALASRIKVMAKLDISERRMPQDGRIELSLKNQPIDLRVSVLPTMFGESCVLRVLDRSNVALSLDKLGMRDDDLHVFRQLIEKPNGILVNTGPTGCGKTTTLYAALAELNSPETKILTVEDPVEYDIEGLVQVQVRPDIGLTFGRALRSFLRMDPDVILVGETRDPETAQIAVQASLTGHLVFTTLHTNDAPSAVARLLDLGIEPFLVTATLEAVVAQRLVRRICAVCKEEYRPSEEQLYEVGLRPSDVGDQKFFYGRGCDYCSNSGYRGRLGLYEMMGVDDGLRDLMMNRTASSVLKKEAVKRGMRTLRESGLLGIFDGFTTIEEVVAATVVEE